MIEINKDDISQIINLYNHGHDYIVCSNSAKILQIIKRASWNSSQVPPNDFIINIDNSIPCLSWICEIKNNIYKFTIGNSVDFGNNFIVEGVWDGNFNELTFGESDYFYGSGAYINSDGICVFVPPRHCTDFIYVLYDKINKISYISNSFCYIFKRININLQDEFYQQIKNYLNITTNKESSLGADQGNPLIAETEDYVFYRLMYHNFTVSHDGRINYLMRVPRKIKIETFNDYRIFLLTTTKNIISNGCDVSRKNRAFPITMLSTGYDSCAVSAICADAGVNEAVTLDVITLGHNDCGAKIANVLGLKCYKATSPLGKNVASLKASFEKGYKNFYEFFATAGIGDNVAFAGMEPYISGKIVFSGLYGDGCWSKSGNGSGLAHHLPYMKSRNEFRLRTGYSLVPMPAFGAYFPYALKKIGSMPEMSRFTLNTTYDRPIPRRIAEEAGIDRALFGQRKAANNPDILNWKDIFDDAIYEIIQRYN